ncbi:hypothetical protein DENSPDRAFT_279358 [Dentipellis sp. KUC8613]|nr:hypothetical protein DENSPDRAFT_279358 [Dentipellis sp. KUC8613]
MASSNPYAPKLSADALWNERATLIGDCISQIVFGILFCVFVQALYALVWYPPQRGERRQWLLIAYTCVLFTSGIVFISMNMRSLQLAWIDNREFPGGPIGYEIAHYAGAQITVPNAVGIVTGWLADGFLLYRCLVIFHMRLHIIALPVLIYLTGVATSILFLFQSTRPGASLWNKTSVNFGIIYFSLSAGLNVIISSLITWHLLSFRRSVKRALGPNHAALGSYGSIAAMVTESSLMYAVVAVMLVIPYGIGSHVSSLFLAPWTQFQILSPMLIILRVAKRRAWNSHTASTVTTLRFQDHHRGAPTQTTDTEKDVIDGIRVHLQPEGKTQSGSAIAPSSLSADEEA